VSGTALMLAAHPPGTGSGSAVRGAVTLGALRSLYDRVDVVSFAFPSEERFAAPGVTLVPRPAPPSTVEQLTALRYGSGYYHPERAARLDNVVRRHVAAGGLDDEYEVVWCHGSLMARAGGVLSAGRRVLDIDNVAQEAVRQTIHDAPSGPVRRAYRRLGMHAIGYEERRRCAAQDVVFVTSETERDLLGRVRPPVVVLPNTVPDPGPAVGGRAASPTVLFVGSLDYGPNVDAVLWITSEILPRLAALRGDVRLVVAGRRPVPAVREAVARPGVELVEDPPTLTPLYHDAHVVLAALRTGGGTGRIKLLEAMAHRAAVVATSQAVSGLGSEDVAAVTVADTPEEIARAVARLLHEPHVAEARGAAAREAWAQRHGPQVARRVIVDTLAGA
jgi:glycosyltransferase involved in cell wall biosynthesis